MHVHDGRGHRVRDGRVHDRNSRGHGCVDDGDLYVSHAIHHKFFCNHLVIQSDLYSYCIHRICVVCTGRHYDRDTRIEFHLCMRFFLLLTYTMAEHMDANRLFKITKIIKYFSLFN